MASAEGGSVPSGVGYGDYRGLGSVVNTSSGPRGRAPAENGCWRILEATDRAFCTYMTKI